MKPGRYNVYHRCNGIIQGTKFKNPDEYLAMKNKASIPVKLRDNHFQLPDSELLNVLHYYISQKFPHTQELFDETALLALGMVMEHWVDELIGDAAQDLYTEYVQDSIKHKNKKRKIKDEDKKCTQEESSSG